MSNYEVLVKDGPSEAALAHAIEKHASVIFGGEEGALEARLNGVEDLREEAGLAIRSSILCGPFQGHTFIGSYDGKRRRGCLKLESVP
jgi:hypothetical protein